MFSHLWNSREEGPKKISATEREEAENACKVADRSTPKRTKEGSLQAVYHNVYLILLCVDQFSVFSPPARACRHIGEMV